MTKFGDLIDGEQPVLLHFYVEGYEVSERMHKVVKEVANYFEDKVRVLEINVSSNREVVRALQVSSLPDFMIYKNGEMHWRAQGKQTSNTLRSVLENYTSS